MGIYLLVFLLTRISALGSLTAVLSYPIWIILVFGTDYLSLRIFSRSDPKGSSMGKKTLPLEGLMVIPLMKSKIPSG